MSTFLTLVVLCSLTVAGSVVGVCLVLLIAERSRSRRRKEDDK